MSEAELDGAVAAPRRPWHRTGMGLVLVIVVILLFGVALAISRFGPATGDEAAAARPRLSTLPGLPSEDQATVGAVQVSVLPADEARKRNHEVPFVKGPIVPAAPFRFVGSAEDRLRASECLATAMLYEAGPDARGQQAVAQVILNRVRHPAFPRTVCGVVYQGSERSTGCQFTFSCDGSMRRIQPKSWMDEARKRALEALDGAVFKEVGLATHYHTDWVYPYWSPSLDKVAAVDTHLFFRWRNYWGTRAAFAKAYRGGEPKPGPAPEETGEADATATESAAATAPVVLNLAPPAPPPPAGVPAAALRGNALKLSDPKTGAYIVTLRDGMRAEDLIGVALRLCRSASTCQVMGWQEHDAVPQGFPVPAESKASMRFSYLRDRPAGREELRFDCSLFSRADIRQCLSGH